MTGYLKKTDQEVARLIAAEAKRQQETINLIASENIASLAVREALGSALTNKYSEGYAGKRYYAGNAVIDEIEELAKARARKLFGLGKNWSVNVQPLSGSPANMAVYFALLKPGDKFLAMSLSSGGHLTHGDPASFSGKLFSPIHYGVGKDGRIDYEEVRRLAVREKPKLVLAGFTAYPRTIDFKKFGEIAREVGAYFMVDMAHIAGLVAAGVHPSPFPYADVVTTTTHKSLRGPRGAIIFSRIDRMLKSGESGEKEMTIARAINRAVFPGLQGGPHDNQTAAIAVCLKEAMKPAFKTYGKQIVENAAALAAALQKHGFHIVSGGTDNHLLLVDLTDKNISGLEAQTRLEEAGIITSRTMIPYDPRPPFDPSGIRLGTPAVTTRGMKEKEMVQIAHLIHEALTGKGNSAIRKRVNLLCSRFPAEN
ncbi:MAG: serine hydroxymethyltransferase [Candidatus Sungbacteria bacterium RIFCSPLOWO2_01_FULL_54_21]|uniref:Serine hydroxymethyltransferase n=2 Tax=Candidatus Sungiibacteriota TaxID=1817917 RepID=A0A1G2LBD4_9BACT|nr:MAG: serine hydroxymethyltransferase [Candidatus Sungbacteria bacterium RIFCSPHIGHO2_01_FULL_54_26]OHA03980.1 MAG: serine hydroxymethyltransferase [Candidatus Sungbacteria bacterium RIFCSPHIGHO2_02_FULL_53_17]OHA08099.1 MAG: serine hydroxymethyltransferase [Candidatus Sungbacteria bacterium RIFCSPLOWO2_01_FULL_54_21]